MSKTIFVGYGNPDRGDDGVAWHLLNAVISHAGCQSKDLFNSDVIHVKAGLDVCFNFQLLPEMAETIAQYDRVIFIDAHTGDIQEDISFTPVEPAFQNSPFTHHFTPASCLSLVETMAGRCPQAWLLSVRGYQFAFDRDLSPQTLALVDRALDLLKKDFLE